MLLFPEEAPEYHVSNFSSTQMGEEDDRLKLEKLLTGLEKDWVENKAGKDAPWEKIENSLLVSGC